MVSLADNYGLFLLFPYSPFCDFFWDSFDPSLWSVLGVCDPEEVTKKAFCPLPEILSSRFWVFFGGKSQSLSAASGWKDCPWSPSCNE